MFNAHKQKTDLFEWLIVSTLVYHIGLLHSISKVFAKFLFIPPTPPKKVADLNDEPAPPRWVCSRQKDHRDLDGGARGRSSGNVEESGTLGVDRIIPQEGTSNVAERALTRNKRGGPVCVCVSTTQPWWLCGHGYKPLENISNVKTNWKLLIYGLLSI